MPYYRAGDYYRGDMRSGNYAAGGLFGTIGNIAKSVFKATPIGAVVNAIAPRLLNPAPAPIPVPFAPIPVVPTPGVAGFVQRLLPGGKTGLEVSPEGFMPRRRRRLDPLNVRALRRAGRRLKGFLRIASRLGALPVNRGKGKKVFKRKQKPSAR